MYRQGIRRVMEILFSRKVYAKERTMNYQGEKYIGFVSPCGVAELQSFDDQGLSH